VRGIASRPAAALAFNADGRGGLVGEGVASGSDGHDFNNNKSVRGHQGDVAEGRRGVARPAKTGVAASGSALDHKTLDRLHSLRGPGERYSNVILRLAAEG
jgi:hypothetical protein